MNVLNEKGTRVLEEVRVGENVVIRDFVNIYRCEIGDNTKVGCFVEIQKNVKIGKNCKIEPYAFIPEGVVIQDGVFIGARTTFINDRYPRAINPDGSLKSAADWRMEKTIVQSGASIGAGSVVLPVTIGKNAMVAAGAVVTKDIPDGALARGVPARVVSAVKDRS